MAVVLAVGPHPDDVEIGMGGTVIRLVNLGYEVHVLDLTNGEPTPRGTPEIRAQEAKAAAARLGAESRIQLSLPNRYLQDEIDARRQVAEVIRKLRPQLMFIPYWVDAHPDHRAAVELCEAARFYGKFTKTDWEGEPFYVPKVLHYLCSHLQIHLDPSFVIDVSEEFADKLDALRTYGSQFPPERSEVIELVETYGRYYGTLIHARYGEPFVCREPIGLKDLRDLVCPT